MSTSRIIVVDGHDGSGKSTLASLLAKRLGGRCVRPFVGTVADRFTQLFQRQRFRRLSMLTRAAVEREVAIHADASLLVFDRHWLTMFSVLPERCWRAWEPRPPTVMCWASPEETLRRVTARGETTRNSLAYHHQYCALFAALARRFGVPVIDTSALAPEVGVTRMLAALELT